MSERNSFNQLCFWHYYVNTGFQSFFETRTIATPTRAKCATSALHISAFNSMKVTISGQHAVIAIKSLQ